MIDLKLIFLFLMVWWSLINFVKVLYREKIPTGNFIYQAVGITGFIFMLMKGW